MIEGHKEKNIGTVVVETWWKTIKQ